MAEANVSTADEDDKVDKAIRKMFEITPFIWNNKEDVETNKPEVARNVDKKFQINLLGEFLGHWGRDVFVKDYTSTDGRIDEYPAFCPIFFDEITKYFHHKSGQRIELRIRNLPDTSDYSLGLIGHFLEGGDGAILFCSPTRLMEKEMVVILRNKIREVSPTIPVLLLVNNALEPPIKWIGQGLLMASAEEVDKFCQKHGFFSWIEICERGAGEDSDFGRAVSKLVDEIIAMEQTTNKPKGLRKAKKGLRKPKGFRNILPSSEKQTTRTPEVASNLENASAEEKLALQIACNGAENSSRRVYIEDYTPDIKYFQCHKKYLNNKPGKRIKLYIWSQLNQHENKRRNSIPRSVRFRNIDGAIVFWDLNSDFMDTVLEYKNEIRRSFPTVPILLLIDNVVEQPVEWIGQGLLMNSTKEMDNFCLEHGFFTWFEMRERGAEEDSDFGRAMSKLVDEIIAMKF